MQQNKRKCEDHSLGNNFFKTINSVSVQSLKTEDNKVFVCTRDDLLVDVWKGLANHKFSSVPVLHKTKRKYYGVVDVHDILNFIIDYFGSEDLNTMENFWQVVEKSEKLKTVTINNVIHYPRTLIYPFSPVKIGYSLYYAMEMFAKEDNLQRIPIVNKDNTLYSVLTISRVVDYLHDNKSIVGNRLNKHIDLLGSSNTGVFSIKETDKALTAFKLMREKNITCIAVENEEGCLTGVISQSDLKSISSDGSLFYNLYKDAKSFIQLINPNKSKIEIISAIPTDTLETVIDLLHSHKLHQIFVINNKKEQKATGIISLRDIVKDILCH